MRFFLRSNNAFVFDHQGLHPNDDNVTGITVNNVIRYLKKKNDPAESGQA